MNFKFFLLISVIAVFIGCTSSNKKKVFFVQEYKILNDSVSKYNGRFATVVKKEDHYYWTKLLTHYRYSEFNLVDSIIYSDSLKFEYSLDKNYVIDRVYNWNELEEWFKGMFDTVLSGMEVDTTDELRLILSFATDSSKIINKHLPEMSIYNSCLYLEFLEMNFPDSLNNYKEKEDDYFICYTLETDLSKEKFHNVLNALDLFKKDKLELGNLKGQYRINYSKKEDKFVSGEFERSFNLGTDSMKLLFRVYETKNILPSTVNYYERSQ